MTALTFPGHEPRARIFQATCAKRRCFRRPVQAFDVWSWYRPQREQTPAHYEVCDRHASYFTGSFAREKSDAVKRDLVEHGDTRKRVDVSAALNQEAGGER